MGYPLHGKNASIKKGDTAIDNRAGWDITFNVELDDVTAQGEDWKKFLSGVGDWSGTMEFWLDPSNTEQKALIDNIVAATPGTTLTDVTFYLDTDDYFSGDIILTSFPVSAKIGGKVTGNFSFQGNGAPTFNYTA